MFEIKKRQINAKIIYQYIIQYNIEFHNLNLLKYFYAFQVMSLSIMDNYNNESAVKMIYM